MMARLVSQGQSNGMWEHNGEAIVTQPRSVVVESVTVDGGLVTLEGRIGGTRWCGAANVAGHGSCTEAVNALLRQLYVEALQQSAAVDHNLAPAERKLVNA